MKNLAGEKLTNLLDCLCDIPSEHSLDLVHMALLWARMKGQGLDKYLFAMGTVQSFDAFKKIVQDKDFWVYAGFSKTTREPCAFAILDNIQGGTARLHYTFFRNEESIRNKELYARLFMDHLFANHTLDCLLFITPDFYLHSNRLASRLGAEFLGKIPGMSPIYIPETNELEYCEANVYKLVSPFYVKGKRRKISDLEEKELWEVNQK